MKKIKIQYLNDDIKRLEYIDGKSDWIDLRAAEDIVLKKDEFRLIPLGVAMQLPEGYEAHIVPRSSTYKNFGIIQTNHMGVVDETYAGPNDWWYMPLQHNKRSAFICVIPKSIKMTGSVSSALWSISRRFTLKSVSGWKHRTAAGSEVQERIKGVGRSLMILQAAKRIVTLDSIIIKENLGIL